MDRWGDGRPTKLEREELAELGKIILAGPDPDKDGLCAFTLET